MIKLNRKNRHTVRRNISWGILLAFVVQMGFLPISPAFGQSTLPLPGTMISLSSAYAPALIKGLRLYPENPLRFDFIVDAGDSGLEGEDFKEESSKLIKYFLSSLTIPDKDLWVNLSPYEKDRIVPDAFGKTEMGRDLLAQDYILKQLSASIIYPESKLGKSFWVEVYRRANAVLGDSDTVVKTFNKIWIVPEKAVVFAKDQTAYVVESHLQVMLEEDYLAFAKSAGQAGVEKSSLAQSVSSKIFKDLVLPQIEKEVNEGENFAPLRQVYHSLMLAVWFKRHLRENILGKIYVGQNKTGGVTFEDKMDKEQIYNRYLEAFQKGVYNYIKEEKVALSDEVIPRKYFSGGVSAYTVGEVLEETDDDARAAGSPLTSSAAVVAIELERSKTSSTVVAGSPNTAGLPEGFSVRDNYAFGSKANIQTVDVQRTPSEKYRNLKDVKVTPITNRSNAIAAFRAALVTDDRDPMESLKAIRPLVEYVRTRYAQKSSFRALMGDELAANFEYLGQMFEGPADFDAAYAQNLLDQTLGVMRRLSDEAIGRIIEAARINAEKFIMVTSGNLENLENFQIALTMNADDVFSFRDMGSGLYVLEMDLLSFLGVNYYNHSNQLAWRYYTQTNLSRAKLRQEVLSSAKRNKSDFIDNNAEVVEEVLRILQYMQDWDGYFGIGRYLYTDRSEDQAAFLAYISADERNRQLVRLIKQLGSLYTEEQQGETTVRLPDTQRRIEAILRFILNKNRLAKRAAIQGNYTQADVQAIERLSSLVFISSTKEFRKMQAVQLSTDTINSREIVNVNPEVYEESLLKLRADHPGDAMVPEAVLASGVDESTGSGYTAAEYVSMRDDYRETIVVIPFERSDERYLPAISLGVEQMRTADPGRRARIFFSTVWPKYLVSVAESWSSDSIDAQVHAGIAMLDASLQKSLDDLMRLSKTQEIKSEDVEPIAQSLRTNEFLTDNRVFVQTEVVRRKDSFGTTRSLLTMISFNIDEILKRQIDGVYVPIRYLGDRLDLLDKDVEALGFMYLGDGHGVVLKQMVRNDTILSLLPELRQAPFQILNGETLHPIYPLMRQAIARDYTFNPSLQQQEALYLRRYRSTARHEGQHVADDKNNVQRQYSGIEKRVAQEITAYLGSIADENNDATPNMPFTDLVKVGRLYISLSSGFGALSDMFGIYRDATAHILLLFAAYFSIEITIDDLRNTPKASIARILEQALRLDRVELKNAAKEILEQVKKDQASHKSYLFGEIPPETRVPARAPEKPKVNKGGKQKASKPTVHLPTNQNPEVLPQEVMIEEGQVSIFLRQISLDLIVNVSRWVMRSAAALALWAVPADIGQEPDVQALADVLEQTFIVKAPSDNQESTPDSAFDAEKPVFSLKSLEGSLLPSFGILETNARHIVAPGQTIGEIATAYYGPKSALRGAIEIYNANVGILRSVDDIAAGGTLTIPGSVIRLHNVLPGDTLSGIAYKYYGVASQWRRIVAVNSESLKGGLRPSTTLIIPMSRSEANDYDLFKAPAADGLDSPDSASSQVGGISLETLEDQMQMQGEGIKLNVPPIDPALLKNLESQPLNGFVPIILNVTPINSQTLPIFLGQAPKEPAKEAEQLAGT